jgi:hypothetical protein
MHCANQYTSRASPLLKDTTLSAQNNAALYRCCTKRLVHKLQVNTIQATSYLCFIVTYCNLCPIMLTKSIYDFTSRRYFSTLMVCSDFTFSSPSLSMFKVPTQCNQHSTIVIKFPTIGNIKTIAFRTFRTVLWLLSVTIVWDFTDVTEKRTPSIVKTWSICLLVTACHILRAARCMPCRQYVPRKHG